jgi:hypothetical protein
MLIFIALIKDIDWKTEMFNVTAERVSHPVHLEELYKYCKMKNGKHEMNWNIW